MRERDKQTQQRQLECRKNEKIMWMEQCRTAQTAAIIPAKLSRKKNKGKTSNGTRIPTTLQTASEK